MAYQCKPISETGH